MNTRDDYINELNTMRPQLEAITLLPADDLMDELTDEEIDNLETKVTRYGQVLDIVETIDATLTAFRTEAARHTMPGTDPQQMTAQKSDPNSTLAILNDVARHLSGRDVEVQIGQLRRKDWAGVCTWNPPDSSHAIKITIDINAIPAGADLLKVFLHEVAHAKQHGAYKDPLHATKTERFEGQLEIEAIGLGYQWHKYANLHADEFQNNGGINAGDDLQRAKLFALLYSDDAPGWEVIV